MLAMDVGASRAIPEFRQLPLKESGALFVQVVQLAREAGLVKLGCIGIDGAKVKANASRHKAMSHGRMREREQQIKAEMAALSQQAGREDAAESRQYGKERRGDELPDALSRRESRLKVIQAANARLEQRRRQQDEEDGCSVDAGSQLIVAAEGVNNAAASDSLLPMAARARSNAGALPSMMLADSGYASEADFTAMETLGASAC